jgi:hypothetical protein
MAKTTVWLGTVDTDWAVSGNWSNGLPVAGDLDTVIIDSRAVKDLLANVDRTGDGGGAGLHLALLHVAKNTTIAVGTPAVPLKLTAIKVLNDSPKDFNWISKTGTGGNNTTDLIQRGIGTFAYQDTTGTGASFISNTYIVGGSGTMQINNTATALDVYVVDYGFVPVVSFTGAGASKTVHVYGGIIDWGISGASNNLHFASGEFTLSANSLNTVNQYGGLFILNSIAGGAGAIADHRLFGGVLDATRTFGVKKINGLKINSRNGILISDPNLLTITKLSYMGDDRN